MYHQLKPKKLVPNTMPNSVPYVTASVLFAMEQKSARLVMAKDTY